PLAGLLVDKGALPLVGALCPFREASDGFQFESAPTEFPCWNRPERYLDDQEDWVVKRSFDGKDTTVGVTSEPGRWRAAVGRASSDLGSAGQRYVSLPRAEVPVLVDEAHLEWVASRVELSSFIYDGAFGGVGVRHAPDAEGLVMTDFPEGYGYSTGLMA